MTRTVRRQAAILTILATFATLATLYSFATPLFETPDELDHYQFARWLANNWSLPVLELPPASNVANQEGGQAPLYYFLGAVATSWVGGKRPTFTMPPNPHGGAGGPSEVNKNIWLHSEAERGFPQQGDYLAAHLIRLVSVVLGTLTVALTYCIGRSIWPGRRSIAVLAAMIIAFNPQFIFLSGAISNDVSAAFGAALVLWALANLLVRPCSQRHFIATGAALGIGLLSKVSFVPLLPLAIAAGYVHWRRRRTPRLATTILCLTVPALLIAGWWYARNLALYADPFATSISAVLAGGGEMHPTLDELVSDAEGLRKSFWAVFGAFNIIVHPGMYAVYDVLMIGAGVGLAAASYRGRRSITLDNGALMLGIWVLIVLAALVRWRFQVLGFQGRLLFPALPAIAVLMARGLLSLIPVRRSRVAAVGLGSLLLSLSVAVPFVYLFPAYSTPDSIPSADVAKSAQPVGVVYARELELVAYDIEANVVAPGNRLPLKLYWRALKPISRDYSLFVHLLAPDGRILGQVDTYPASTMFPTSKWPPQQVYAGKYFLPVANTALNVSHVRLVAGLYLVDSGQRATAQGKSGQDLGDVVDLLKLPYLAAHSTLPPETATLAVFGDSIAIAGFHVDSNSIRRGGTLKGEVYWRALRATAVGYTVFLHLVKDGKLVAQYDGQPLDGHYPTNRWSPGEVVRDSFQISIPATVPAADYQLTVGLYDPVSIERLRTGKETYYLADIVRIVE